MLLRHSSPRIQLEVTAAYVKEVNNLHYKKEKVIHDYV